MIEILNQKVDHLLMDLMVHLSACLVDHLAVSRTASVHLVVLMVARVAAYLIVAL